MILWKCMRSDDFMLIIKVIFTLEVLKVVNLPYFVFFNLWWSCIYTRADDVTGDRTPEWEAGGWKCLFYFKYFVLILCKYLKSLWREIYFETLYQIVIYIVDYGY